LALDNVKGILNIGSPLSSYKLLLMQGGCSRPKFAPLFRRLLQPFVKNGRISVQYRCHGRMLFCYVRTSELESDFYSIRELGVNDVYSLDLAFHPDLVIDGGGNIGMFTLRAAAGLQSAGDKSVKHVICEPVPGNVEQIRTHLAVNGIEADVKPVCLGGTPGTVPFYLREANQSSFESAKPYRSVTEIPVITLQDAIGPNPTERILIKLDIEGMEVEVLNEFLPSEHRPVYLVGELHNFSRNAPLMQEMFRAHGWTLELLGIADDLCSFRGCSPAALPLLPSFSGIAR
jgi:FkbM family methyltransferase